MTRNTPLETFTFDGIDLGEGDQTLDFYLKRAADDEFVAYEQAWRTELTKVFPALALMSFAGPEATARWIKEQIERKS